MATDTHGIPVKRRPRIFQMVGIAVILLMLGVAGASFFLVRGDIADLRLSARENILWDATQLEIELMRFDRELAKFEAGVPGVTPETVNRRFDILWSRLALFREGSVGERLRSYDQEGTVLNGLARTLRNMEGDMDSLVAGDKAAAERMRAAVGDFNARLRHLSQKVLHGEAALAARLRDNLSRSASNLTMVSILAVIASLVMLAVFAAETRRFRHMAEENERLLRAANRASRAKSQFLAMMSHELRTPLNGVMGLLSLVRQQRLSSQQQRLLNQAERSGRQMIGLLEDILDFTALQEDRLQLEQRPFEVAQLAEAIQTMFGPVALREGTSFSISLSRDCPAQLTGDFARLRQALTHLCAYVLETAGTRNITLTLSYRSGNLVAEITFEYSRDGGGWAPELILGRTAGKGEAMVAEALGPAVARGLIEQMQGATRLDHPGGSKISVVISVPAGAVKPRPASLDEILILVATRSSALEAICRAALRDANVRFLDSDGLAADEAVTPQVVMIEAGSGQEQADCRHYRQRFPAALLVALGKPSNPADFDDIVGLPIDLATIRRAPFMQLARRGGPAAGAVGLEG